MIHEVTAPSVSSTELAPSGARILVVDDDQPIAELVATILRDAGYDVREVIDPRTALETFAEFEPALVMLDVMMPSVDGVSLCLQLRRTSDVPVLFLSAKKEPLDRVVGLRVGADDYMGKPFDIDELVARVQALLRRSRGANVLGSLETPPKQLRFGTFVVDRASMQAVTGDQALPLTPTEFKLLSRLAEEPARVFTRDELLAQVWGYEPGSDTRLVDVHVGRLRKKLWDAGVRDVTVETSRGFGYRLVVTAAS